MGKETAEKLLTNPALRQIYWLEALLGQPEKRGIITRIAQSSGVNHSVVSRFFQRCTEAGYINDEYELTKAGREWLDTYTKARDGLYRYFSFIGIESEEAEEKVGVLLENMDLETIHRILLSMPDSDAMYYSMQMSDIPDWYFEKLFQDGEVKVAFSVLKYEENGEMCAPEETCLSMANQGFFEPAVLRKNNRGIYIGLSLCDMVAKSAVDGSLMRGRLSRMKYEQNGNLIPTEIRKAKVKIPLDACRFRIAKRGGYEAAVSILCACTVGKKHMPERKARLVFWI